MLVALPHKSTVVFVMTVYIPLGANANMALKELNRKNLIAPKYASGHFMS